MAGVDLFEVPQLAPRTAETMSVKTEAPIGENLMASTRRIGSQTSATRDAILAAATQVLKEEGAGALTASKIAKRIGVKAHMVHYYFRSMEELVLALVRQHGLLGLKNTARAIASDEPLRALWEIETAYKWSIVAMELSTFALHHETVGAEMMRYIEDMRTLQADGIARHFELNGIVSPIPPMAISIMIAAIARQIQREKEYKVALGHDDMFAVVEQFIENLRSDGSKVKSATAAKEKTPAKRRAKQ